MFDGCSHSDRAGDVLPTSQDCATCVGLGDRWVHLRMCMVCGHVGCCDQSKNHHASGHFADTGHPLIQSFEPGEDWWYCYVDDVAFRVPGSPTFSYAD